jgi:hypothetical protein
MASHEVKYTLLLEDLLTGKIKNAEQAAKGLQTSVIGVKDVLAGLGVGLGIFEIAHFAEQGIEKFEELHQNEVQLADTMMNMGTYSKKSFEQLIDGADKLTSNIKMSKTEAIGLLSQVELLGGFSQEQYLQVAGLAAGITAKFGGEAKDNAALITKALNAPEMASRILKKANIPVEYAKQLKDMVEQGDKHGAQLKLLEVLQGKFKTSAQEAFNADPLAQYNKLMGKIQIGIGEYGMKLLVALKPALLDMVNFFKKILDYTKQHADAFQKVGVVISYLWGVVKYTVGLIADFVVGTINEIIKIYNWLNNTIQKGKELFIGWIVIIKEIYGLVMSLGKGIHDMMNPKTLVQGILEMKKAWSDFNPLKDAEKARKESHAEYVKGIKDLKGKKEEEGDIIKFHGKTVNDNFTDGENGKKKDTSAKSATGQKVYTINIKIDNLIKEQVINTTNLREGAGKIKDMVTEVLLAAVNDSQMIAER